MGAIFNLFCPQQGSIKPKQEPQRLGECRALCELASAPSAGVAHEGSGRDGVGKDQWVGERRNTWRRGGIRINNAVVSVICLRKV